MEGFLQTVVLIAVTVIALWALARWAGKNRREIAAAARAATAEAFASARTRTGRVGPASSEQLGRSLADSLRGERSFFSRTIKVAGGHYVIYVNDADYPKVCAYLREFVSELTDYLRETARNGSVTLVPSRNTDGTPAPFAVNVVQILARDEILPGKPILVTYAAARAMELTAQNADGIAWTPPHNPLLEPHELSGAHVGVSLGVHPVTGSSVSPASASAQDPPTDPPVLAANPGAWSAAACTAVKVPAKAPVGVAYLEVAEVPTGTEPMPAFMTIVDRAAYGRARDLGSAAIPVGKVSRQHFMTTWNGHWRLHDLGSQHGTSVNGERVETPVELEDGDEISVADVVRLVVHLPGPDALDPPTDV